MFLREDFAGVRLRNVLPLIIHKRRASIPAASRRRFNTLHRCKRKKDIKPIVLDYDQTNLRLNVVDRGFLIWLKYQQTSDLLELIGLPPIS
jgi:hypothetical protein